MELIDTVVVHEIYNILKQEEYCDRKCFVAALRQLPKLLLTKGLTPSSVHRYSSRVRLIIRIMPPMIRHARLRYPCYLMLILYETTLSLDINMRVEYLLQEKIQY